MKLERGALPDEDVFSYGAIKGPRDCAPLSPQLLDPDQKLQQAKELHAEAMRLYRLTRYAAVGALAVLVVVIFI